MPFFILTSILLIYTGFESGRIIHHVLAGLIMGIAFLTKEASILFFPLPIISFLLIKEYRNNQGFRGVTIFLASLMLTISPWVIYVFNVKGSIRFLIGNGGQKVLTVLSSLTSTNEESNLLTPITKIADNLANYVDVYILEHFFLAPLIFIAIIYALYKAIYHRDKTNIFLLLVIILFLPLMTHLGIVQIRLGQTLIIYLVNYVLLANFTYSVGVAIVSYIKKYFSNSFNYNFRLFRRICG